MSKPLRYAHYVAIGFQAAAMSLFLWVYVVTGEGFWAGLAGYCLFFGALHTLALRADRKGGVKA